MATLARMHVTQLPRMPLLYIMEYLQPQEALQAGLCCKALYENSCYDWLWRQFYNRRWLFRRRGAVGKEAYIRRHLTERGMEEGKASQYSVTTMRGGAFINAMQVRDQDVFVGYEDGRVLVWDASTGGREPKEKLATMPDAVQSLWLYRESHLIAVSRHAITAWEFVESRIQLAWEQRFDLTIASSHVADHAEYLVVAFESGDLRLFRVTSGISGEVPLSHAEASPQVFIEAEPTARDDPDSTRSRGAAADGSLWSRPITAFLAWTPDRVTVFKVRGKGDFVPLLAPPVPQQLQGEPLVHCELVVTESAITLIAVTLYGRWYTASLSVAGQARWRVEQMCTSVDFQPITCVKRDGNLLALGTRGGVTCIHSLTTGLCVHALLSHSGPVTAIWMDRNKCLTGGGDKCMKVWRLHGARPEPLYALLGGSRTVGGRDHPDRPGCSGLVLDEDRVTASFADVLRVYNFSV